MRRNRPNAASASAGKTRGRRSVSCSPAHRCSSQTIALISRGRARRMGYEQGRTFVTKLVPKLVTKHQRYRRVPNIKVKMQS